MSENTDYTGEIIAETASQDVVVSRETGEIVSASVDQNVANLNQAGVPIFSTFVSKPGEEFEDSLKLFGAINNAEPISEHLNKKLDLVHIVAMDVVITDPKTEVKNVATRVIFVTNDGKAYAGISNGLFRSVQNILGVFPPAHTWPKPVPIKVLKKKARLGDFFTVELAL